MFKNLPTHIYIHLMNTTSCLIGNSSSGVREGAFIGTPVVNIGTRQNKRLRTNNVIQVDYDTKDIVVAIKAQIEHGKYESSDIYGDGTAGKKIANILVDCEPSIQKTIVY
jgi:UDP-N-acetylglucosamine 2-epimerase